jgi:Kyakuja-Dileera-Zisupton transposase
MLARSLQTSTCESQHDAILRVNTQSKENYLASGTGLVLCARHTLVRKNGVGDLQKGQRQVLLVISTRCWLIVCIARYCNMDYIVLSALMGCVLLHLLITYDIACQWS